MKQIPLRVIQEKIPGAPKDFPFDYAKTMLDALRAGGLQGITIDGMSRRISVIDKLEAAVKEESEYVLLEEAEYKTLLDLIKTYRFRAVFRSAIQMKSEIENAATVEVDIKKEKKEE